MEFKTGVIRPIECFKEGWKLIKDQYWLFLGITLVGLLIGGLVPLGIVLGSMMCGIYFCLFKKIDGQPVEFNDLFKGFDYFLPSLIVSLFVVVPTLIFTIVMQIAQFAFFITLQGIQNGKMSSREVEPLLWTFFGVFGVATLIFGLLLACLHALIMFAYPLVVERRMKGVDAFKLSARAVWKNLNGVVGIILCEFVLGIVGLLLCYVGAFLLAPLSFAAVAVAYRKVFPPLGESVSADYYPPPPPTFVNES